MKQFKDVSYDFSGRTVLVTGAGRGQGMAHALSFAMAGADVAIVDVDADIETVPYGLSDRSRLEAVAAAIEKEGVRCLARTCDVRDPDQIKETVAAIESDLGKVDILVNNAGVESVYSATEMPTSAWDDLLNTNLRGSFLCAQAVLPGMVERQRGKIVNVASTAASVAIPNNSHYVASKHGVMGLTKALAVEFAPHRINVNAVCPGSIDTPMNEGLIANCEEWIMGLGDLAGPWNLFPHAEEDSMLVPEEVSQAVLWLSSDAADFVTGASIAVDAGFTIK
jgi:NAD(P)-dependent dehydrogenase (short-subunit alcohol dehydrogenase family)